jgi:hypothetical protein
MTMAEAIKIMGPPTDKASSQASWYAFQWGFSAFLGSNGLIHQLDINEAQLSAADNSRIGCETTRVG